MGKSSTGTVGSAAGRRLIVAVLLGLAVGLDLTGCGTTSLDPTGVSPLAEDPIPDALSVEALPGGPIFLSLAAWDSVSDGRDRALNPCLPERLGHLGAQDYRVRAFRSTEGGIRAQDVIASFHSSRAAVQGLSLVLLWQNNCVRHPRDPALSPHRPVTVPGVGDRAVLFRTLVTGPGGRTEYATGVVRVGPLLGAVTVESRPGAPKVVGSDTRMQALLQRAARRLA